MKVWYIYVVEYYWTLKKNEPRKFGGKRIGLEKNYAVQSHPDTEQNTVCSLTHVS